MIDTAPSIEGIGAVSITQSRKTWELEIGRHQLRVTRMTEARTFGPSSGKRRELRRASGHVWPLAIGTFASVSALSLLVFGAIAAVPSIPRQSYALSVAVPPPAVFGRGKLHRHNLRIAALSSPRRSAHPVALGTQFDAADEPYVAKAMRSGDLQEWTGQGGDQRFLSVGPEQIDGRGRCRDLVLLVRDRDGASQTHDGWRCAPDLTGQSVKVAAVNRLEGLATASPEKQDAELKPALPPTDNETSPAFLH